MDNQFNNIKYPKNENQVDNALRHIRTLSQIAARDAGFVTESIENKGGIYLSQNLYVTRTIETEIHNLLDTFVEDELLLLLISGEAGFGKTSLLWHLYHTLAENNQCEIWFIKSTFLLPFLNVTDFQPSLKPSSHLAVTNLLAAVELAKQQEKTPVVLLDTVDLLLHNESDRENLLEVLFELRTTGCLVIASSRPQEAIHLRAHVDRHIGLQAYDDQEMKAAVGNHVHCFYARAAARDMAEYLERILNGVSNGLQIREVCTNPLTLRMLFTLYAPEEVPLEINTFQLYQKFWELRIATDHRAGSSYSSGENLGNEASIVALSMLVEGTPELTGRLLERYFKELHGNQNNFNMLISRGIIHCSEDGTSRFFHQTFFEHCAARGLLLKFKQKAILLLQDRMKSNPNDLFVSPIMEQTLLLAEDEPRQLRTMGDDAILELLKSDQQLLKTSGIYVYIHRRKVNNPLVNEIANLLSKEENVIINRFLTLVPNMPQEIHRVKTLFSELTIVWERNTLEIHKHILELLERLAGRFPYDVDIFVGLHNILDFSQHQWALGFKNTINMLVILIKNFPPPRKRELVDKLVQILRQKSPDALHDRILEALIQVSKSSHFPYIADECEASLQVLGEFAGKKKTIPLAKLFYIQWNQANVSIRVILDEIKQKKGFSLNARLLAMADCLLNTNQQEASMAWEHFTNETEDYNKWMWVHLVIPKLITGNSDIAFKKGDTDHARTLESVLFFREKICQVFTYWSSQSTTKMQGVYVDTIPGMDIFQKIRKALILAEPEKTICLELLNCPALVNSAPWLDPKLFGELLADACNTGHLGAINSMRQLVDRPLEYSQELITYVGARLKKLKIHNHIAIDTFISFCLKTDDTQLLQILIENNRISIEEILPKWNKHIYEHIYQLVLSSSEKKRRRGLYLWKCLITFPKSVTPTLTELGDLLQAETVNSIRGLIIELIAYDAIKSDADLEKVMATLRPFGWHKDESLRDTAIIAMLTALFESGKNPGPYIEELFDMIQAPPVKVNQAYRFGWALTGLIPGQIELAVELLGKLLLLCDKHLKCNPKRDLHCYLRQPTRKLLHSSPLSSYDSLLKLVPLLEWPLGALIVEAICYENFSQMIPQLDQLLENFDIPGIVKEKIRRHKYNRERTLGGEGWPELENLLCSDFHPAPAVGLFQAQVQPNLEVGYMNAQKKKILFLSANQVGEKRLFTDREYREIDAVLRGAKYRHQFELISKFAVRYSDIRQALLDYEPHILHFSGHGSEDGLLILDEVGVFPEVLPTKVVSELFKFVSAHVECVILSCCYSKKAASAIARHISYVIGMSGEIKDNAAIEFSKGFYDALGAGRSIEDAFHLGRQVVLHYDPEFGKKLVHLLKKRNNYAIQ